MRLKPMHVQRAEMNRIKLIEEHIKLFPKVYPTHKHESEEGGINPLYSDIEHCDPLCGDEKIIWVLRGDLTLAVGIKNAAEYINAGSTNIADKVDESMHCYINFKDRYGHPSLAMPENDYDGSVYIGGWLRVYQGRIDVYLLSGRYDNPGLTPSQKQCLEQYLSIKFRSAYGEYNVVFWDWDNNEEIFLFVGNQDFPSEKTKRVYLKQSLSLWSLFQPQVSDGATQSAVSTNDGIGFNLINITLDL